MLKFSKTDRDLELNGTWLDFDDGMGNVLKVLVARSDGNPHYDAAITKATAPYQKKMEKGKTIPPEVSKRLMTEVAATELLLGWDEDTLTDEEGNGVKYCQEASIELLTQDTDLRDFVLTEAGEQANFLRKKK